MFTGVKTDSGSSSCCDINSLGLRFNAWIFAKQSGLLLGTLFSCKYRPFFTNLGIYRIAVNIFLCKYGGILWKISLGNVSCGPPNSGKCECCKTCNIILQFIPTESCFKDNIGARWPTCTNTRQKRRKTSLAMVLQVEAWALTIASTIAPKHLVRTNCLKPLLCHIQPRHMN